MGHSFASEHAVHHVDHTVPGVIVHVDDVGHGEDACQGHLALLQVVTMFRLMCLSLLTWLGKAVTVTLSPAPVTRGVGPGGKSPECRAPLVTCLKRTDCRATRSDNRA